ncbi:unnamed protein product, partial [Ectocarpus sp. 13 AM-2016]
AAKVTSNGTNGPAPRPSTAPGAASELAAGAGSREGRCQGSWEGEGCGGRFTEGKGWLQGTQVFLQIGPRNSSSQHRSSSGGTTTATSGLGSITATGAVAPSSGTPKSAHNKDDTAQVLITITQEDSRYHRRDYTERGERRRSIGTSFATDR